MRFSVIVPVCNVEDYLDRCLSSLRSQTFRDFEVVMVDDGSTDGSYRVMERYHVQDKARFHMIRQENRGLGGARNAGMRQARGEYLFFLDSDDYILPETLEIADDYLSRYRDDLLMTRWRNVVPGQANNEIDRRVITYETLTPEQYICDFDGPQSFFIRAAVFRENGLVWPEGLWYEDHALLPMFALYGKGIGRISARLYQYMQRDTSIMHSRDTARMMEIIDGCDFYLEKYRAAGKLDWYYEELEYRTVISVLFTHIPRLFSVAREMDKAKASWQYVKDRFPTFQTNPRVLSRARHDRSELLMMEGRLEELWDAYYAPLQERVEHSLASLPAERERTEAPTLSVIIPIYNVQDYLIACLSSVIHATEGIESEVILINDGSTDGSGTIARAFAGRYGFISLYEQENRGLSAARNRGMRLARGKYIAFVDSDDEVYPDMYRNMLRMAEAEGADIVACPAVSGFDPFSTGWQNLLFTHAYFSLQPGLVSAKDRLALLGSDPAAWNKLYRTMFLRASGVTFPEGKTFEDNVPAVLLYGMANRVCALQKAGYFYRSRKISGGGSPSIVQRELDKIIPEKFEMLELALRLTEETGKEDALLAIKDRYLGYDVNISLPIPSLNRSDHLPAYLDTLRGWLKRCYTPQDISRQRGVMQAKVRALMQDDLDALVRIDQYDWQDYWKEPVTLENGQLIRHLDEQLLGVEHEPAFGLPYGPLPGVYADRYDKRPGLLRLRCCLTIPGLPLDTRIGGTITASLVGAVTGNACSLDVEAEEGLHFALLLPEETLRKALSEGEEQLLRVEVSGSFGAFAAYVTCPTDEKLFRDDAQALWLRRLVNGRICFKTAPVEPEPLVSVILPVYNARETLPRAVRSLLAQTHENLEILLIDDGSDDGSAALCDAYAAEDARVKAFHLDHGGVARARNFALERYTGDDLMFVDADDLVSPDIVARLLEVLRQSGQQIAACIAKDTDDQAVETITCAQRLSVDIWRWSRINYHNGLSRRVVWGALYSRTAIDGLRFDERYVASTDTLFFAEAARRVRRYAQVNEQHYCYVYYPNSVCHRNSDQRRLDDILVWERILKMNPAGSKGYRSAWRVLNLKLRRLMNECLLRPGHDLSVCLEARRIARRHRRDAPRGKSRKSFIARRSFMTAPVAYVLVSKAKSALRRLQGKGR